MPRFIATYHLQGTTLTREIVADNLDEAIEQAQIPLKQGKTSAAHNARLQHFVWMANTEITAIEVRATDASATSSSDR